MATKPYDIRLTYVDRFGDRKSESPDAEEWDDGEMNIDKLVIEKLKEGCTFINIQIDAEEE